MPDEQENKDMEFSDSTSEEDSATPEIPKEVRVLRTQAYDKSVDDLVKMVGRSDIILDPEYQRNYIWDNRKASLLVESILLNVPIPVIYVAEDQESRWVVVDGLQRLYSLQRFFANEFKLSGLEVLSELNRTQYSKLNPKARRVLNNGILRIIVILEESHPEIKYDIFLRLNRGSIRLNEQELRNCLYRGSFNNMLKDVRTDPMFLESIALSEPHKRFNDAELILRFLALYHGFDRNTGKLTGYTNRMKTFLNTFMGNQRTASDAEIARMKNMFLSTVRKVRTVFDPPCFRRVNPDGSFDARVNRALMDLVMISFAYQSHDVLAAHKAAIETLYAELPRRDAAFSDAIVYGTSDTKKIEYRVSTWINELERVLNA